METGKFGLDNFADLLPLVHQSKDCFPDCVIFHQIDTKVHYCGSTELARTATLYTVQYSEDVDLSVAADLG